jgi:hypothetical protein
MTIAYDLASTERNEFEEALKIVATSNLSCPTLKRVAQHALNETKKRNI